jgi:MFS superfamily sulfate permease-like transporter
VSTCGFGDISATIGDDTEALYILLLQFVGMLFYSMTIQNVQSIIIGKGSNISAGEFANQMVEVVENLIVKAESQLPHDSTIPG